MLHYYNTPKKPAGKPAGKLKSRPDFNDNMYESSEKLDLGNLRLNVSVSKSPSFRREVETAKFIRRFPQPREGIFRSSHHRKINADFPMVMTNDGIPCDIFIIDDVPIAERGNFWKTRECWHIPYYRDG